MAWSAAAQNSADGRNSYFLGTATTGGTYHPVGVALSTLIKLKLLPGFDVDLTAINTDGSQQNVELIRRNDIQFAIISALAGHEARTGTGQFADVGADENLRAITTLWLSSDHLLVRSDAVDSGTIDDFLGLKGRPMSLGRQESSTLLENRMLMSAFGVDIDNDFDLVDLGYGESAEALAAGRIDGMGVSGGVPIGAVQDVFENLGDGVAALDIDDEQLAQIDGGRGLWQRVVIPSGTYPGQSREIFTIGAPNILAVRADVDEDVVYQITKTIFEELEYLHGLHSATRQISLDSAVTGLPLPVHEGAERYFAEKGVELPLPPIELDPNLLARYPTVEEARAAANRGTVTLFAGTEGDTATRIAAELASVLDGTDSGIRLLATNGGGIGHNLTDLLYLRGVDTALVRADLLNYARDQGIYPTVQNQVAYISEMFPEEIHLLVGSDIADFAELAGKKINLGAPGSGSDITAGVILSQLGVSAEPTYFEARTAIEKLKQGEIQGAFLVGGKPMPLLEQIEDDSGLKLLSVPSVDYFDSYRPADISGSDYPNLMAVDEVLSTIAVRTALLTYAWRPDSARYEELDGLTKALFQSLLSMHDDGYHPKWREVDPIAEFAGWQRFEPALRWLDDNQGTARRIASEGRVRIQEQNQARRVGAGGGEPISIEGDVDAALTPDPGAEPALETEPANNPEPEVPPAAEVPAADVPSAEPASDERAVVPTAPVVELTPAVEPAGTQPQTNGVAQNEVDVKAPSPPRSLTVAPTTRANSPTF
ncbi:MAG: TAXI family TRAP transporter solute-binding subunit [Alphaproteobacteria bacterium]|nr:TAXI family TRAP transporter solute-binding subunit [Alphaproteobacteria bacterium]